MFFEVPNLSYILRDHSLWDIIYEHCSYFCAASLEEAFRRNGYRVSALREAFAGQFLCIEAHPAPPASGQPPAAPRRAAEGPAELAGAAAAFARVFREQLREWNARLDRWAAAGRRPAIWGAGAKGCTFLNLLDTRHRVRHAVDVNPHKNGRFVPGTGQEIVVPDRLAGLEQPPDTIIMMNPVYRDEIAARLDSLGLAAEIVTVL